MPEAASRGNETLWIGLYFAANLALTIHNKWVLSRLHFAFPWCLTALHIGVSGVGAWLVLRFAHGLPPRPVASRADRLRLLLFSLLYAVNIAVSNISLRHVSLAFHQIVRSATPAFTVLLEWAAFRRAPAVAISLSLIPVMLGICLATADELGQAGFSLDGFWLTVLGVALSAAKGTVTNALLVGHLHLHPLDLLWKMSIPSVVQCLAYAWAFGEAERLPGYRPTSVSSAMIAILGNGLLAFALNWVSFTANQRTSALSMTVAGNVKQALSILLAVWVFSTPVSFVNAIGILVTVSGGAWYSALQYETKRQRMVGSKSGEYLGLPVMQQRQSEGASGVEGPQKI